MKKHFICFLFLTCSASFAYSQEQRDTLEFDFHESMLGFSSPEELATLFFNSALKRDSLNKYFSPVDIFLYMIARSAITDKEKAYKDTYYHFKKFEDERRLYTKSLLDNLDANKMDSSNTKIDTVEYTISDLPGHNGKFKSADITIKFSSHNSKYSLLLDDCGRIKGKWFIMTPYILWQGKEKSSSGSNQGASDNKQ